MISVEHARTMAAYNRAINRRIYRCCAQLSDAQRKQDVGAFFKSIHGTLNHLLVGDRLWMARFTDSPIEIRSLDQELCTHFDTLHSERAKTDAEIVAWASGLRADNLSVDLHYTLMNGTNRQCPTWFAVAHFFNHQAHHRGQLTTLLSQLGIDFGVTDLIAFDLTQCEQSV